MNTPLLLNNSVSPDQILEGYGFQAALYNRMLGVQRVYIECADDPAQAEDLYNQYVDLVKTLSESIRSMDDFDPSNPTRALQKCFEVFNGELGRRYGATTLLSEAITQNSWDCDNSAFLFYDAVRMAQVSGVQVVLVPGHCLLKTGDNYFESTSGIVQTKEDTEKLYTRIDWEGTDSTMLFGLMFNQKGMNISAQDPSEFISLIKTGAMLGYSPMSYYTVAADNALKEGDIDLCTSYLSAASKVTEGLNPKILFHLGEMHLKLGMWQEALADFSAAISVDPNSQFGRLKQIHLNMKLGNWDDALSALMEHLQHQTSTMTLLQVAVQIPEDFRDSIQNFSDESTDPKSKVAFHLMKAFFATAGKHHSLSDSELRKAEEYALEDPNISLFRGIFDQVSIGYVSSDIIEMLQRAVHLDPTHEIARLELGRALQSKLGFRDITEVISHFEVASQINPENDHTKDLLASCYLRTDPEKAIMMLQTPRSSTELETKRYELLADAQLKMGDAHAAYENYKIAQTRKLTSGAQNNLEEKLGDCAAHIKNWEWARWHYETAILENEASLKSMLATLSAMFGTKSNPDVDMTSYPLLFKYGRACVGCSNNVEAISALTRYVDSQEDDSSFDVTAYHLRGIAYQEEGDFSKAKIDLEKFLKHSPGNKNALGRMERIAREEQNYAKTS